MKVKIRYEQLIRPKLIITLWKYIHIYTVCEEYELKGRQQVYSLKDCKILVRHLLFSYAIA